MHPSFVTSQYALLAIVSIANVVVGALLGILFTHATRDRRRVEQSPDHTQKVFDRIQQMIAGLSDGVGEHSAALDDFNQELTEVPNLSAGSADAVAAIIARLVVANMGLQQNLAAAENQLQAQAQLLEMTLTESRCDPLTGLYNRRAFDETLERRVGERRLRRSPVSLMLADLDYFKRFNDRYGHQAGDLFLQSFAALARLHLRETDLMARFGGEEFAAILAGTDLGEACLVAERLRRAVERHAFDHNGESLRGTVSLGVAEVMAGESRESIVSRADEALYAAKNAGRNLVYLHDGAETSPLTDDEDTPEPAPQELAAV